MRQTVARARSEQPRTKEVPQRGPSMKKNQQRSSSLTHLPAHSLTPLHSTPRHATPLHSRPLRSTPLRSAPFHPSIHPFMRSLIDLLILMDSRIHWLIGSLNHWFADSSLFASLITDSWIHWFLDSLNHRLTESSLIH